MSLFFEKYDSLQSFELSFDRPENPAFAGKTCESRDKDSRFTGTKSFEDALNQLKNGRPDIINDLKKDAQKVSISGNSTKIFRKNDFAGYAPNVGRALAGLPKDMRKKYKVPQPAKTTVLVYSCSAPGCVNQDTLDKAGRAFFRLAYSLEQDGIKTKIFVVPYAGTNEDDVFCLVKLKDFSGRFDLTRLSFPLTSPSMLRRFGFRFLETVKNLSNTNFCYGYGAVLDKNKLQKYLEKLPDFRQNYKLFYPNDFIDCDFDEKKALEKIEKKKA